MIARKVLALTAASLLSSSAVSAQSAFPGALGFGASTTGGNTGSTVHVTTLADSGNGSLRDAVSAPNRNIVFDVGGYIVLKSVLSLSSHLTINGQSAPGGGIGIMAAEVSATGKSDIIIRNVRIRQGTMDATRGKSAINIGQTSNVILDHCSFEYGQWDTVDAVGATDFTVSNSIIALPIGQQFGAHVEGGPSTFYGNLWVSCHNRQPLAKADTQFINNVIYNYQAGYTAGNSAGGHKHDIINNYFIAGPSTTSPSNAYFQVNAIQSIYASGNFIDGDKDGKLGGNAANSIGASTKLNSPWASTSISLANLTAAEAVSAVFANAGASPRDEVDALVVSTAKSLGSLGAIFKDQANTKLSNDGYGTLSGASAKDRRRGITSAASRVEDINNNAIADFWEEAHGISLRAPNSDQDLFGESGYTNLVVYLSSLILPPHWTSVDLNTPGLSGASTYNSLNGLWALTGSGENQQDTFDQCQFASHPWSSQSVVTTKVNKVTRGSAGLLLRSSAEPHAAFVALVINDFGTISLLWRSSDGVAASGVSRSGFSADVSLRIEQSGSDILAYTSTNGGRWSSFGTAKATFTGPTRAGIAVTSDEPYTRAMATFSDLDIIAPVLEL